MLGCRASETLIQFPAIANPIDYVFGRRDGLPHSLDDGGICCANNCAERASMRIPTKPAMHSNSKPVGYSDLKPATRGVIRMGLFHDVVEGWEGQETG